MDVQLINPVLETPFNVLNTMANFNPEVGNPSLKNDERAQREGGYLPLSYWERE